MDCSSLTELMLSEALGFTKSDIMFSSNVTPLVEYQKASDLGAYINLDDYTHIDYLNENVGIPETTFCRYNPGGVFELGTDIMDNPGDAKYGFTKEQMIDEFQKTSEIRCQNLWHHTLYCQQYRQVMNIIQHWQVFYSVWQWNSKKKPVPILNISTCPAVSESLTHQTKSQMILP